MKNAAGARSLRLFLALALAAVLPARALAAPVKAGHLTAELVADHASVAPGQTIEVALSQVIEPGWHTYWRNPGDSGQATALTWSLTYGWRTGDIAWPTPERLPIGPLMDYGYTDRVLLPVPVTASVDAQPGQTVTLKAHAAFLVCKDICVPADADLSLALPVTGGPGAPDPIWGPSIAKTLADAPARGMLQASMAVAGGRIRVSISGPAASGRGREAAYFYPYDSAAIDHAQPQAIELGPAGLTLTLTAGSAFKAANPPAELDGVLSLGDKAYEILARKGAPLAGAAGLGPPASRGGDGSRLGLGVAVVFAFLGGLILNLMPCVFPVLSMKAAALARHAHQPGAARLQGLAFASGVIATFLALAGALIAARAGGEAVGWGFQLQSPAVLAALSLVMLLVALNLSGVFEVGAGVQALAGSAPVARNGLGGAVLTGVLAVAVAAPCSAPFMASAVGYALVQPPVTALAVFLALGVGMAAPFTALAFAPALLARLPRPGGWMEGLRHILAFPMYGAAAWLFWVLSQRAPPARQAMALGALLAAAFAAWCFGVAQRARLRGSRPWSGFAGAGIGAALAITAALSPASEPALAAQPYAPARLEELRAAGKPVFVNLTAAWCVTCQVNERLALSGRGVADAFRRDGVAYLVGDWTKPNADIDKALAAHGRAGVPLYLMYGAGGRDPVVLPQILTEQTVVAAADRAARPS